MVNLFLLPLLSPLEICIGAGDQGHSILEGQIQVLDAAVSGEGYFGTEENEVSGLHMDDRVSSRFVPS